MTAVLSSPTAGLGARSRATYPRARRDAGVRLGAFSLLWLSLLLVTYWWVADRGVQDLATWAGGLTSIGRLTGLVASVLLLAQVLLMARLPVLEQAFGQDRLARQHRLVGFTSFNLMLAHVVLITWGYAAGSLLDTPSTLWTLTVDYPGMLLAVAGTGFLVLVVATSIKAARRKLRYESWHLLHLYAYLGVGLALPHQLWTGQEFLTSRGATVFWWTAWASAAAAIVVFRVALPLWRSARHGLRVTSVRDEGDGVVSVYLTGRRLDRLRAEAGQFFQWRFLGPGWTRAHPYSLSAAPDGRSLRISVKSLGDGSAALASLRPGTRALVEGPYGRLSPRARSRRKVALIGAGVGITPLRALAEGLAYAPGDAVVLYRFRDRPLFEREFHVLARERGLQVLWLPGRRRSPTSWLGANAGRVDDATALGHWVPDLAERDVYVCGPDAWADDVRRSALALGLPPERFHVESFGW
ncbi:ferric reductase-like transmembrane domain-containing protein [Nocardioides sp.]|uniref:ferredoxin reductase family protein n=1 Tax=Nocardioides sp. TaxID=35761 RepID=UPI0035296859